MNDRDKTLDDVRAKLDALLGNTRVQSLIGGSRSKGGHARRFRTPTTITRSESSCRTTRALQ